MTTDVRASLSAGQCPDCGGRGFVLGPMAGINLNIECASLACRVRFNVTLYSGAVLLAQRIETRSQGGVPWPSEPRQ
jgi:hypothetical protein